MIKGQRCPECAIWQLLKVFTSLILFCFFSHREVKVDHKFLTRHTADQHWKGWFVFCRYVIACLDFYMGCGIPANLCVWWAGKKNDLTNSHFPHISLSVSVFTPFTLMCHVLLHFLVNHCPVCCDLSAVHHDVWAVGGFLLLLLLHKHRISL